MNHNYLGKERPNVTVCCFSKFVTLEKVEWYSLNHSKRFSMEIMKSSSFFFFLKKLTTMRRPSRTNNNRDDSTEGDSDAEDNNRTETVAR